MHVTFLTAADSGATALNSTHSASVIVPLQRDCNFAHVASQAHNHNLVQLLNLDINLRSSQCPKLPILVDSSHSLFEIINIFSHHLRHTDYDYEQYHLLRPRTSVVNRRPSGQLDYLTLFKQSSTLSSRIPCLAHLQLPPPPRVLLRPRLPSLDSKSTSAAPRPLSPTRNPRPPPPLLPQRALAKSSSRSATRSPPRPWSRLP